MPRTDIINQLLTTIHKFYSVGHPALWKNYPGYADMDDIVQKKLAAIQTGRDTQWDIFIKTLQTETSKVFDIGGALFPSFYGWIETGLHENERFKLTENVHFCVSLICPFYTVFYEDRYVFTGFEPRDSMPILLRIYYSKSHNLSEQKCGLWESIQHNISLNFPENSFISHKLLFDQKIQATFPYGSDPFSSKDRYSIYSLLFNGYEIDDSLSVRD
jgi:hypothetical protein